MPLCGWWLWRSEEGVEFSGTGVIDGCKPLGVMGIEPRSSTRATCTLSICWFLTSLCRRFEVMQTQLQIWGAGVKATHMQGMHFL